MISTVPAGTTSLYFSVHSLLSLIVDVLNLTRMMLLFTVVSHYKYSYHLLHFLQIPLGSGTVIVFKEEIFLMKDVLRSIVMDSGERYVIMDLVLLML